MTSDSSRSTGRRRLLKVAGAAVAAAAVAGCTDDETPTPADRETPDPGDDDGSGGEYRFGPPEPGDGHG